MKAAPKKKEIPAKITLANKLVEVGLYYRVVFFNDPSKSMFCKFIKVSETGFNFLNMKTGKCIFRTNVFRNKKMRTEEHSNSFFITYLKYPIGVEILDISFNVDMYGQAEAPIKSNISNSILDFTDKNVSNDIETLADLITYNNIFKEMKIQIMTIDSATLRLQGNVQKISSFIELRKKIGAFETLYERPPNLLIDASQYDLSDKSSSTNFFEEVGGTPSLVKNKYIAHADNQLRLFKKSNVDFLNVIFN